MIFTLVRLFFYTTGIQVYSIDMGYHFGNFLFGSIQLFGEQMEIGDFVRFTELVESIISPEEHSYYLTNFLHPSISLILIVVITSIAFFVGMYAFKKKEIST